MSKNSEGSPKSANKLNATALAVGTSLGLSGVADAAVVYSGLVNESAAGYGGTDSFTLDVNSDGVNDFTFSHYFRPQGYCGYGCYITHRGHADVIGFGSNGVTARSPLAQESFVGQGTDFDSPFEITYVYYYSDWGTWNAGSSGYMGFVFDIDGENHYGWFQLSTGGYSGSVTLVDFAYETEANVQIRAGSLIPIPAAAPLFSAALGAMGISAFRRRKREYREKQAAEKAVSEAV